MATYAIGDIQGCYDELRRLLDQIGFDRSVDHLWFVGDLINRGPQNLETLRFVRSLGHNAVTVLGNHDLHFLAVVFGGHSPTASDTFDDVIDAGDCEELCHWLRSLPLLHENRTYVMTHAGIPHVWDLPTARSCASEIESTLRGPSYVSFFEQMYGNHPNVWTEALEGMDRTRLITNYFTRMRLIREDGALEFSHKGQLEDAPREYNAWFHYTTQIPKRQIFGHWASLEGETGVDGIDAIDTGAVWGRSLTALRLDDHVRFEYIVDNGDTNGRLGNA